MRTDAPDDSSVCSEHSSELIRESRQKLYRRWIFAILGSLGVALVLILTAGWWHYSVQPLPRVTKRLLPIVRFENGKTVLSMPNGTLVGEVGTYTDELTAYLRFDYLKGLQSINSAKLIIVTQEKDGRPEYEIYLLLPNDILAAYHTLAGLTIGGHIRGFELESPPPSEVQRWEKETALFNAAYRRPVRKRLLHMPRKALTSSVASFILFKIRTDRRVRQRLEPAAGKELSRDDARNFAADMIAVAEFYDIPLDMLLGVGAMENNYLDIRGDLKHAVWKSLAQPGDIVLRRRRWASSREQLFDRALADHARNAALRSYPLPA